MTTVESNLDERADELHAMLAQRQADTRALELQLADAQRAWTVAVSSGGDTTSLAGERVALQTRIDDARAVERQLAGWLADAQREQRERAAAVQLEADMVVYVERVADFDASPAPRELVRNAMRAVADIARDLAQQLQHGELQHEALTVERAALAIRQRELGQAVELPTVRDNDARWSPGRERHGFSVWLNSRKGPALAAQVLGTEVGNLLLRAGMLEQVTGEI